MKIVSGRRVRQAALLAACLAACGCHGSSGPSSNDTVTAITLDHAEQLLGIAVVLESS
jgi:hypothetical protein